MKKKYRRLRFLLFVLGSLGLAAGLALYALKDNISYFRAPAEIAALKAAHSPAVAPGRVFRLGGMVVKGSVQKRDGDLSVRFTVTDMKNNIDVVYKGILPDLFRDGQGVVADGSLDEKGVFIATQLLAKHDEKYMPPDVAKALEKNK